MIPSHPLILPSLQIHPPRAPRHPQAPRLLSLGSSNASAWSCLCECPKCCSGPSPHILPSCLGRSLPSLLWELPRVPAGSLSYRRSHHNALMDLYRPRSSSTKQHATCSLQLRRLNHSAPREWVQGVESPGRCAGITGLFPRQAVLSRVPTTDK